MENFSSAFSDNYWGGSPISCTGLYKLDKEENIEQLYKFFGVPWFMRKILGFIKPKPTLRKYTWTLLVEYENFVSQRLNRMETTG